MSAPEKLPELFGSLVFNEDTMRQRLSSGVLRRLEALHHRGHFPGPLHRQRDRRGHEAVGHGEGLPPTSPTGSSP